MNLIKSTGIASLVVQILTGIIDAYALSINVSPVIYLLKQLLWMEFIVQLVEGAFYIWLIRQFFTKAASNINITKFRYYDWPLTTPTMLLTFSMYLIYIHERETRPDEPPSHLLENISKHWKSLSAIAILNWLMLGFGYLGETNVIPNTTAVIAGFVPFFIMFYLLYHNFAKLTSIGTKLFWYFAIVWSIYGIAALLKYVYKNALYNVLDLFAKNFFGIFLAVPILTAQK